jgi:Ca2+-binding RTX toxin-like protein
MDAFLSLAIAMTTGTPGNDLLFSTNVIFEVIDGLQGIDTVSYQYATSQVTVSLALLGTAQDTGGSGFDTLISIENLTGSNFNDRLSGNAGNNILNGGRGIDTADYRDASGGVTLSLATTRTQNTGSAGFDRLISIENLIGSNFADRLTGSNGNNVLVGGAGNDTFIGSFGNDTLNGDTGDDIADYSSLFAPVTLQAFGRVIKNFFFIGPPFFTTLTPIDDVQLSSSPAIELSEEKSFNLDLETDSSDFPIEDNEEFVLYEPRFFPIFEPGVDTLIGIETIIGTLQIGDTIDLSGAGTPATGTVTNLTTGVVTVNGSAAPLPLRFNVRQFENVIGSSFADSITGDGANNSLNGGEGNDTLFGTASNDTLEGGKGDDLADYSASRSLITLGAFGTVNKGRDGVDTLIGIETILASTLLGDTIDLSGAGAPATGTVTNLTTGVVTVNGSAAPLPLTVNVRQFENVIGSSFADSITGDGANNSLNGGEGNDTLSGTAGNDTLNGDKGDDLADYSASRSLITLGAFGTVNKGRDGVDTLIGIETILASTLLGDTIDLSGAGAPATGTVTNLTTGVVTVNGSAAPLPLTVNVRQFENVIGSSFADSITGDGANNNLNGGEGNDSIIGGDGRDTLIGGVGRDTLRGSQGDDTFIYSSLADSLLANYDLIVDYSLSERIDRPGSGATLNFSIGIAAGISARQIGALLNTPGVFEANSCQAFTAVGFSGTFIAFNDGVDGYNEATDSIIQLTSYVVGRRSPIQIV